MTRRMRRTIFYALVALFLLLGTLVTLYAQGWRLDITTWRANKVGAIFIRAFPADAEIVLDGRPIKSQIGLLSRGTFISDLFPKSYNLALRAKGYADWHETLTVLSSLVTEFKYAVLVPQKGVPVANATSGAVSGVKKIFFASGEIILEKMDGTIAWRGKTIRHGSVVSASTDLKSIVIKDAATGRYLLYDVALATSTNLSAVLTRRGADLKNVTSIMVDPTDATKVIIKGIRRIWIFDAVTAKLSLLHKAPAGSRLGGSTAASPSLIAWTDFNEASRTSAIVLYDKFGKTLTRSATATVLPGENAELKWIKDNLLGARENDGSLYLYGTGTGEFQKLADDVKAFEPAEDGSAIAALEHKSLEIFPLTDAQTYHRFNLPDVENATAVAWYKDLNHLFVTYSDRVSFLDLDDLSLKNFTTVAHGTAPFYDQKTNTLYLAGPDHALLRFEFPT